MVTPTQGIHDMPSAQYFASSAVSNSDLKWISDPYTPAHFRAYKDGLMERPKTEAMKIGSLTHTCILEPEKMAGSFMVKPDNIDGRSKAGKEWLAGQTAETIISQREADMLSRMVDAVWKHPLASEIIAHSDREKSLFAEQDGLWLKGRIDCLLTSGTIIADLKTCELSDLGSVEKAIFSYGYHRQAAYYLKLANLLGLKKSRFAFIFVEKTPPHCVAVYTLTDDTIRAGEQAIAKSLKMLKKCTQTCTWPGRNPFVNMASLPQWAMKQSAQEF
jgi:exodeoxyribonuclease VIII